MLGGQVAWKLRATYAGVRRWYSVSSESFLIGPGDHPVPPLPAQKTNRTNGIIIQQPFDGAVCMHDLN